LGEGVPQAAISWPNIDDPPMGLLSGKPYIERTTTSMIFLEWEDAEVEKARGKKKRQIRSLALDYLKISGGVV
jgi:hypothetical protein